MNYLAHCCLVPNTPETLAGSILGDVIHGPSLIHLPPAIARAVRLHRWVDKWTDEHPENLAARQRFLPPLRRFAGIIVDMAYDHFLAREFQRWEGKPLAPFAAEVYQALRTHEHFADNKGRHRLRYIYEHDLLNQYTEWSGVQRALRGIGSRFSRPTPLQDRTDEITPVLPSLYQHFLVFYPQLKAKAAEQWQWLGEHSAPR